MRIGIVKYLRTVAEGLNPPCFFHRIMSTVVQVVVNLLRKDVASQKYIILHDATANPLECHYGKLGWET